MAKKKPAKPATATPAAAKTVAPHPARTSVDWTSWAYHAEAQPDASPLLNKLFYALLVAASAVFIALSFPVGINADEKFQDDYADKIVKYYSTGGEDRSALYEGDQSSQRFNKYYGGFFEIVSGYINKSMGNNPGKAYHTVRHFLNSLFGVGLLLVLALWAKRMAGTRAAIVAIVILLASPRTLGHSVMNPKDIPYATGYLLGIYFLYKCLLGMPRPQWQHLLGLALGGALATATRAGGVLIFCYSGLFFGIDFLLRYGFKGIFTQGGHFLRYAGYWLATSLVGFGLAVACWPFALEAPIANTLEALKAFSSYPIKIIILFQGENTFSDAVPTLYPVIWLGISLALSALVGIVGSVALSRTIGAQFGRLPLALLFFAAFFPLVYVMAIDSALFDGWRHLQFIYPPMVLMAALFFEHLFRRFQGIAWGNYAVWGGLLLLSADALLFTARNPAYPYTYFNPIAGGVQGAFGQYEMDYWGLSTRQAIEWMEDEGILHAGMDTLTIGTTFPYNVQRQLDPSYKPLVKVQYVRYHRRFSEFWDYGVFPSRFIRGAHLQKGTWPMSKKIHSIDANGVPLTVIERDENQYAMKAEAALKTNNVQEAITLFQQEVQAHPDNEQGWTGLASAYLTLNQPDPALEAVNKAMAVAPENETGQYLLGYAYLIKGDAGRAEQEFYTLLKIDPENAMGHFWLGEISLQRNELQKAFDFFRTSLQYNPKFPQAYERLATIYEKQGNAAAAAQMRQQGAQAR